MAVIPDTVPLLFIPLAAVVGIAFAILLWYRVSQVTLTSSSSAQRNISREYLLEEEQRTDDEVVTKAADIQEAISEGANSFLFTEYLYMGVFAVIMSIILIVFLGYVTNGEWKNAVATTVSFIIGAATSVLSGFLGMKIATYANARTAVEARKGIAPAFMTAFRAGAVMGFLLSSAGVLVIYVLILAYYKWFDVAGAVGEKAKREAIKKLYESLTGYGLGGSSIALFGRVGGGIYTKAADVGADLVGKVEKDIPEDDPRNPAVIADNVGDNVGDIAGMGADLFGSFAESTCAALVVASVSSLASKEYQYLALSFPVTLSAAGILVCLVTTLVATDWFPAKKVDQIEETLKIQLWISTTGAFFVSLLVCKFSLPDGIDLYVPGTEAMMHATPVGIWICVSMGLWGGLLIGLQTEYFTSNRFQPVRDVSDACRTGAATNIIFGLALGYKSAIIPAIVIALNIYIGFFFAGMLGIACAALGMLNTLATGLAIDAYGPISDNAGGIAEMAGMGEDIRERTDALDAAGNTTAAIGKGFAIGSAALVSLALFGAFITRSGLELGSTSILDPKVFSGLLIGAMLPYWFSAMTMKSVGKAALAMVEEVRRQFNTISGLMEGTARPDYKRCVEISTKASLGEMIAPGFLVMASPLIVGGLFGTRCLAGLLAGALVSGVQLAISMSNTGGAWDNAKKYIEAGASEHARDLGGKGSDCHKAAVIGDTVGDPLKDTSGPSLNILVKLMAVESLVFAPFFLAVNNGDGLVFGWFGNK